MMTTRILLRALLALFLAAGAAACTRPGPVAPPPRPEPIPIVRAPVPEANPGLPPVPHVAGPLQIKVVYPTPGQLIQSKDSNFIFGSIGNGDAALTINGVSTPVWPNGAFIGWLPNPPAELSRYDLVAAAGADTARFSQPIKLQPPPVVTPVTPAAATTPITPAASADTLQLFSPAQYATLIGPAAVVSDTDRVITAYAPTGGIQRWFLIPNTVVKVVSVKGNDAFIQLDSTQTVRIERKDLTMLAPTYAPVALVTKAFRVIPAQDWVDIVVPVSGRPAYLIDETPSSLTLTLYSSAGAAQPEVSVPLGAYVSSVASSVAGQDMRYTVSFRGPAYGYEPLWQDSVFTLRVRRPPAINASDPLNGITIAIDPGHPPGGAHGPTDLYEAEAVLAVGLKVQALLAARGVNVFMTRTTPDAVDLNLRPTMARRVNAHALVSIHLNALPDGMNPFVAQGTTTYHYWMHSEPLASAVHKALLARLALPDKGVKRENFALVRATWMPAILCEGAFIMMPDQEAALRTAEYQDRYARGVVEGLEAYFRTLGQAIH